MTSCSSVLYLRVRATKTIITRIFQPLPNHDNSCCHSIHSTPSNRPWCKHAVRCSSAFCSTRRRQFLGDFRGNCRPEICFLILMLSYQVKSGLAQMLKVCRVILLRECDCLPFSQGGVIMDVVNAEQVSRECINSAH